MTATAPTAWAPKVSLFSISPRQWLAPIADRTIDDALCRLSADKRDRFSEFMARVKGQLQSMLVGSEWAEQPTLPEPVEELV